MVTRSIHEPGLMEVNTPTGRAMRIATRKMASVSSMVGGKVLP